MRFRQPGKTLQQHARLTGRMAWIVLSLALVVSILFLYVAFDTLLKSFGNRADPARTLALYVGVVGVFGLGWAATRLFNLHDRARQGAQGEEWVGAALDTLQAKGWYVFHDLPMPAVGNVDHLVIGPPGVFVVETKSHRGRITAQGNQLLRNGKLLEKDFLRQVKAQSMAVNQLFQHRLRQNYYVQPVVCFSRAFVQVPGGRVEHVWVLPLPWLLPALEKHPSRLSPAQVQMLASVIAARLRA
ncbi:MAG: NERD domain-containing protein [Fimbriimonadales bacterium]|nr:NERD domain-containing protein [Fimbriimonadales bacterium]